MAAEEDFSIEPLLNQSSQGTGTSKRLAFVPIDLCGVFSHRTPLTINNTAQEVTIGIANRTIIFMNSGDNLIYFGGAGVTSVNGIKLLPNIMLTFANVKDTFSIYFVTDGAETSTLRIIEAT